MKNRTPSKFQRCVLAISVAVPAGTRLLAVRRRSCLSSLERAESDGNALTSTYGSCSLAPVEIARSNLFPFVPFPSEMETDYLTLGLPRELVHHRTCVRLRALTLCPLPTSAADGGCQKQNKRVCSLLKPHGTVGGRGPSTPLLSQFVSSSSGHCNCPHRP